MRGSHVTTFGPALIEWALAFTIAVTYVCGVLAPLTDAFGVTLG